MSAIPAQMKALAVEGRGQVAVKTVQTPQPAPGTVIVKVSHVALNPTDWKHIDYFGRTGALAGSDFSGTVVALGDGASGHVAVGDRVFGTVHGGWYEGVGAFAEYVRTVPTRLTVLPESISDADGAGIGIGSLTAIFALFQDKHLALPFPQLASGAPAQVDASKKLLVWSGASSVGQFAVQLGRLAGMYVITTSSPKNFDKLKGLGAAETYSYADEKTPEAIAAAHPDLKYALDTFSEKGSQEACARALSKNGAHLAVILTPSPKVHEINASLKVTFVLLYSTEGHEIDMFGVHFDEAYCKQDAAYAEKMLSGRGLLHQLLVAGLQPNRSALQPGGIDGIADGLQKHRTGQVSGEKLIFKIE